MGIHVLTLIAMIVVPANLLMEDRVLNPVDQTASFVVVVLLVLKQQN